MKIKKINFKFKIKIKILIAIHKKKINKHVKILTNKVSLNQCIILNIQLMKPLLNI